MTTNEIKHQLRQLIEHAYQTALTTGDGSVLEPYYQPEHKIHTEFHNTKDAHLDGAKAENEVWAKVAKDYTTKANHILVDGDYAAVHWAVSAHHHGSHDHNHAGRVKGANKHLHVSGVLFVKLRDGKIEEEWRYDNILQGLISAGAVEIPAAA